MSSSTLNNSSKKAYMDDYSSCKWYHHQNNHRSSSNNHYRKKSISYLKNGDFYVDKLSNDLSLSNSSLPDLNRFNDVTSEFRLNVYNDNKWIRINIKSLRTNKTNFFKLKHKRSYYSYYLSENNDLKFESLTYLIEYYQSTKTGIKIKNELKLAYLINPITKDELDQYENKVKVSSTFNLSAPPSKPTRVPTIKYNQKPEFLKNNDELISNIKEEDIYLVKTNNYDIKAPNLNLKSLIDLANYDCNIIKDKSKRLDRLALIEITKILSSDSESLTKTLCSLCKSNQEFPIRLAKCLTYYDFDYLRFSHDFGLGIFNGLELLTLPHGDLIRNDLIERFNSSKLFLMLMIVLCQDKSERINLIINLLDCAFYLFEKLRNLFAFSYIMEAFNDERIIRLTNTWSYLKEINEFKYNLMLNLNEKLNNLKRGNFIHIEQQASIPNLYPIALLLNNNSVDPITADTKFYLNLIEYYLSISAKYYLTKSSLYTHRCEQFIQNEYINIFGDPNVNSKCTCNLSNILIYLSQTEFHQIILWSDNFKQTNRQSLFKLSSIIEEKMTKNNIDEFRNRNSDDFRETNSSKKMYLNERILHALDTINILSFKIQQ